MVSAKLPFMTRLPRKRGITQDGEDKSLILRQNVGNSPEVTSDQNSCAELEDLRAILYRQGPQLFQFFSLCN